VRRWLSDHPTLRGFLIILAIVAVVVALSLESTLAAIGGLLRIAFFLAVAFFLFLVWRERRGDLEAWDDWSRRLFYAAIGLAVVAIGMALGYGLPESRDALALVLVLAACAFVVVRVWRREHRY
jgi:predicted MFS family arabinose efflux permease